MSIIWHIIEDVMIVTSVPVPHQYFFQPTDTARNMTLRATPTARGGQLTHISDLNSQTPVREFKNQITIFHISFFSKFKPPTA